MNDQQQQATGERTYERCFCCEAIDRVKAAFGVSPPVRQHLVNSRIELLKAFRAVIDRRIENLSRTPEQGTRVTVE